MVVQVNHLDDPMSVLQRRMSARHTPDILDLLKWPFVVLMVYDALVTRAGEHRFLEGCPFLGQCTTLQSKFRMDLAGDLPVVFDEKRKFYQGYIRGEAYLVSVPLLMKIDVLKANTIKTQRQRVMTVLDDQYGNRGLFMSRAFMYIGLEHAWKDVTLMTQTPFIENNNQTIYEW